MVVWYLSHLAPDAWASAWAGSGMNVAPAGAGGGRNAPAGATGRVGAGPTAGSPRDETRTFTLTGPQPP